MLWRLRYDPAADSAFWDFVPLTTNWTISRTMPAAASVPIDLFGGLLGSPSEPLPCPAGTFKNGTECEACEPGFTCSGGSANTHDPCPEGEQSGAARVEWLVARAPSRSPYALCRLTLSPAPRSLLLPHADSYNPLWGASSPSKCLSCSDDFGETFGSNAGSASCSDGARNIDCSRGSPAALSYGAQLDSSGITSLGFVWDADSAKCAACAAGSFQDSTGSAPYPQECSLCPAGTSTKGKNGTYGAGARAACSTCGAGAFASNEGTDECDVCPTGLISRDNSTTGNVACTPW